MEFNLPTTKEQMHQILVELFDHYRVRKEGFEETTLEELSLERLNVTFDNNQELTNKARELLKADQEREIQKYNAEINAKILGLRQKIALIEDNHTKEMANVSILYEESIKKVQNQAVKSGLVVSSVMVDKTALLEDSKNQKIADLTQAKNFQVASITAEIEQLNAMLEESEEIFYVIHQKELDKKYIELCDEREKTRIEIFKYNNSLEEKEQRHANSIKEAKSSLHLRFLEIKAAEYTKDQLVEMGYFKDVIACVSAYYDTLEPLTAYQSFLADKELMTYLDFYYEQVALYYKLRAGL